MNLEEEIRDGYKVSADMKKLWSVQMEILDEIDRICKKHNITYYADGGTLLGAIRHKGFIPWDDDLDVQMYRDDLEKFCKVAKDELKPPFFFRRGRRKKASIPGFSRSGKATPHALPNGRSRTIPAATVASSSTSSRHIMSPTASSPLPCSQAD